jgi:hypothetical protein
MRPRERVQRSILALACIVPFMRSSPARPRPTTDRECAIAFRTPPRWASPAPSRWTRPRRGECSFTIRDKAPHSDQRIDVRVRFGELDARAEDLGFERRDSGWVLHGEDVSAATRVELGAGVMLLGTAATRPYENGVYRALADETRCIISDNNGRVIELYGFVDDSIVRQIAHTFSFLAIRR